ncbi:hypothetical protein Plav_3601 [Parvibaculum lavamentivorans DS-1]|uniref:Uncharacterized protein n=1 Tax=Parvibaculum lavamentivorans (strain DS-1 / DSM 13023 / NCIMB 13966) TaxID=402881 RepID=A7HZ66_PARL1|nr:hypothetical protein [Parvibaculum lavamentivorans]ABS65199.1 hypothetical protein Plav_3601 [Parvibaculum lavamentivorans DS-1]
MRKTAALLTITVFTGSLALAGPAAMAGPQPVSDLSRGEAEELCQMLDDQFQFTMKFKSDLPYADKAQSLRDSGMEKCSGENPAQGVADLRDSLETMHVVPATL